MRVTTKDQDGVFKATQNEVLRKGRDAKGKSSAKDLKEAQKIVNKAKREK